MRTVGPRFGDPEVTLGDGNCWNGLCCSLLVVVVVVVAGGGGGGGFGFGLCLLCLLGKTQVLCLFFCDVTLSFLFDAFLVEKVSMNQVGK